MALRKLACGSRRSGIKPIVASIFKWFWYLCLYIIAFTCSTWTLIWTSSRPSRRTSDCQSGESKSWWSAKLSSARVKHPSLTAFRHELRPFWHGCQQSTFHEVLDFFSLFRFSFRLETGKRKNRPERDNKCPLLAVYHTRDDNGRIVGIDHEIV